MKKLALIMAMVSFSVSAQFDVDEVRLSVKAVECAKRSRAAASLMLARQRGIPLSKLNKVCASPAVTELCNDAWGITVKSSEYEKQSEVTKFKREVLQECIERGVK